MAFCPINKMETFSDSPHHLPFPRQFLTRLIDQLSASIPQTFNHDSNTSAGTRTGYQQSQNDLSKLSASQLSKVKSLMLTLHCLFPNELLLALDILDRRLVRRFTVRHEDEDMIMPSDPSGEHTTVLHAHSQQDDTTRQRRRKDEEVFFVRSTSVTSSSSRSHGGIEKNYEVRLQAWNCTCPAFALSAFRDTGPPGNVESGLCKDDDVEDCQGDCWFGGTLTRDSAKTYPPVCKHLLACVLGAQCPALFGGGVEERGRVSAKEFAGWCAGWDD